MKLSVRVSETDALGHINNKSYIDYMEESRNYFFEQADIKDDGIHTFILAKVCCEYVMQGYFGQTLYLKTELDKIGNKSVILKTYIYNDETKELIAQGESIVVFFHLPSQQSLSVPDDIKAKLLRTKGDGHETV